MPRARDATRHISSANAGASVPFTFATSGTRRIVPCKSGTEIMPQPDAASLSVARLDMAPG